MDAVRFLNFLQSFAASAAPRVAAQPLTGESLQTTLSDFEAQLRALMQPAAGQAQPSPTDLQPSVTASSVPAARMLSRSADPVFVTGGGSALAQASVSRTAVSAGHASGAGSAIAGFAGSTGTGSGAAGSTSADPATPKVDGKQPGKVQLQQIIAWQKEQLHPMLNVRIGDIWTQQGITDPLNHPDLMAQAEQIYRRGEKTREINSACVLPWTLPFQPAQTLMAASTPDPSGFVTGGRG
jgi:hypothetical protein